MTDAIENLRFIHHCPIITNFVTSQKNLDVWYKLIWSKKNYTYHPVLHIYSEF